jgi:type I restriction enzyme S subunit
MGLKRGYKQSEVGVIPEDWDAARLSEVADLQVGFAFKSEWFGETAGPRLLRGENVGYGRADWSETRTLKTKSDATFRAYLLNPGEVVIGMDRTFTKTGSKITMLHDEDCPCLLVQRVGRLIPRKCDSRFLWFVLTSEQVKSRLRLEQKGMDIPHLSRTEILHPMAAFPPLSEQRAIAEALSDVDELIGALDQLISKKRDLKQAAMQQLLTGQKRLPGFSGEWEMLSLSDICTKIQDGTHFSPKLGGNDYLYVTSKNIGFGTFDISTAERISATEHRKIYARCDVRKGDILLTKDGANTGNAAVNTLVEPFSLLSSVALLRFDQRRHVPAFFLYQILTAAGQKQIKDLMSGNAITRLTLAKIRLLRFGVASFEEQTAIAEVLSDMDSEIAALEQRRDKTRALKQGMMQELLTGRTRLV